MRIHLASVFVDDQAKALDFYTRVLGFQMRADVPLGPGARWLTVGQGEDTVDLVLEPAGHPAVAPFREALVADGIPWTSLACEDVNAEHERLTALGVQFVREPATHGQMTIAVFDDTCGNLIQIASMG
nr:VOC family protein [Demequina sp.]